MNFNKFQKEINYFKVKLYYFFILYFFKYWDSSMKTILLEFQWKKNEKIKSNLKSFFIHLKCIEIFLLEYYFVLNLLKINCLKEIFLALLLLF